MAGLTDNCMVLCTQKHPTLGSRFCHLQILNDCLAKGSAFYVAMGPVGEEAILAHKALFWPFPDSTLMIPVQGQMRTFRSDNSTFVPKVWFLLLVSKHFFGCHAVLGTMHHSVALHLGEEIDA